MIDQMEIPSLAELRQKNPFCKEHLNLSYQSIIYRRHHEVFDQMKAEGARIDEEMDRRSKDKSMSWQCIIQNCKPEIRAELIALRRRDEAK
jgi:hypothetical protein